jgi:outer membrane protein OmpA-like peptidoglycan-associated protein
LLFKLPKNIELYQRNSGVKPEFLVKIRIVSGILLILFAVKAPAQNLIPNSGFEEIFTQLEYQWVQPQGPYYHYEAPDSSENIFPKEGRYVNGLCMYNYGENEFLHIKLLEPLKAEQEYVLRVDAVLMKEKSFGSEFQKYIGFYFGTERLNTHIPGDLYFKPQVNLQLPDSNRYEWFQMVDTFKAVGGESFLTIGYFPETQVLELKEQNKEAYWDRVEQRYKAQENKVTEEDKSWLYLPPDEQKKYLKEQKKKNKKKQKGSMERNTPTKPIHEFEERPAVQKTQNIMGEFAVRYYFDNFCLAPLDDNGQVDCSPENPSEELATGSTINLRNVFFETDESKLREESFIQLSALKDILNQYADMQIEVRGYTDNIGEADYNLELSTRRAEAVVNWLIEQEISSSRLSFKGFGEADPVETNETTAGRARNRRVTFHIISM